VSLASQQAILEKTFCLAAKTILLTSESRNHFTDLVEKKGHLVLSLDKHDPLNWDSTLSPHALKHVLKKPLGSLLVEGGPRLLTELIKTNQAVGGHIFMAPLFLGGHHRVGQNLSLDLKDSSFLNLKQSCILGRDVLLEWTRQP
jgi:riboflavin biosynthesis pyrimidine reductase